MPKLVGGRVTGFPAAKKECSRLTVRYYADLRKVDRKTDFLKNDIAFFREMQVQSECYCILTCYHGAVMG